MKKLINDAKQWVEQEKVWGGELHATAVPSPRQGEGARRAGEATVDISSTKSTPHPAPPPSLPQTTRDQRAIGINEAQAAGGEGKSTALQQLYNKYKDCTRCRLGFTRIKIVFGVGNANSRVLFIGEGPGYEEDRRGEPFVGKSGQLLDKMMAAIGLSRQTNAYIANIVKCHPMTNPQTPEARGNDRPPAPDEVATCSPILLQQIAIIQPRVIMTLGSPSTKMVLHTKDAITGLRGKKVPFDVDHFYPAIAVMPELNIDSSTRQALSQTEVIPTYHPAALLRNPNLKPDTWTDLKLLRDVLAKT